MSMIVAAIPVGARLIDTEEALGPTALASLRDEHVDGIIAYLGGNLTPELIKNAHGLGMGVVPVNFSHGQGWLPSSALGAADAENSVRRLAALGIPLKGLDDWCDIEGCGGDPTSYCVAWCERVLGDGAGRVPGEYVGAGALLSGHQHYMLPFEGYWHSCSRAIPEPDCGFKMYQLFPPDQITKGRLQVDYDFASRDFKGRAPTWVIAA